MATQELRITYNRSAASQLSGAAASQQEAAASQQRAFRIYRYTDKVVHSYIDIQSGAKKSRTLGKSA